MANSDLADVWARSLDGLADLQIQPHQRAWLKLTRPLGLVENTALIATPNEFVKEQLETRLRALVTQVKHVDEGGSVGYGREWFAPQRSRVATVAAGYADGIDRRNGNRGRVILGGSVCPIIGRVSMDQLGVDVTETGDVEPGDTATLIGRAGAHALDADVVAAAIDTIANEVLCAVSSRVPRVVVNAEEEPR